MSLTGGMDLAGVPVLVVGAGLMGAGIAQVAAQAGHPVLLFDAREGAAAAARSQLAKTWQGLVVKGRLAEAEAAGALERVQAVDTLAAAGRAGLVIEAIIEDLAVKRTLLRDIEGHLGDHAVLASNTSSISITALANGLQRPGRFVGMHFFNPVPLMKLVEVVHGLQTDPTVADAVFALAQRWGKTAVHCKSTPGFIVNRIARPYYAEALAMLQEQAAAPAVLDACLRGAGFRMGPCELMDLIGHDTNFAVTRSVYEANFYDKRFVPSLVQRELVDGGLLGRKTGQGFFTYPDGASVLPNVSRPRPVAQHVVLHGRGALADALAVRLAAAEQAYERAADSGWTGLQFGACERLALTDGRTAQARAMAESTPRLALFDLPLTALAAGGRWADASPLALSLPHGADGVWADRAAAWLQMLGFAPQRVEDTPGLVVARTVAMLVNEAADAVQQGVCSEQDADLAMTLGVNYPAGPFQWLSAWSAPRVGAVLSALDAQYRGERYRISPWLARRNVT